MTGWTEFALAAPRIAATFTRRHAATGNLCLLGTLRSDGFPRISPVEPTLFDGELWIAGMPGTTKFRDLSRDPRFCLHTATVDTNVTDGDAKLWGLAEEVVDEDFRRRFAQALFDHAGLDIRDQEFDCFHADVTAASSVEVRDGHMDVTIWKAGEPERVVRKH